MGRGVDIGRGAYFGTGENLEIGDCSGIGINCELYGPVKIGNGVMMGPEVVIYTRNHEHRRTDVPIGVQGHGPVKPVRIGNDVWIGRRVMMMPGTKIGTGAVVAAGAVVTKNVPDFTIVAGVPAKVVRHRK